MGKNVVKEKSFDFALKIISLYKSLVRDEKEFVLSKQLLRSGTAIGALVREAEQAESKKDFIHKLSIALKESNETDYWLALLLNSDYISSGTLKEMIELNKELLRLLTSIIKTTKQNLKN